MRKGRYVSRMSVREVPFVDLPARPIEGLAAVPPRGPAQEVLVTAEAVSLAALPDGLRIGVDTVPRAAQMRRAGPVEVIEVVEIRPDVAARLRRVGGDLDGVVVAATTLRRLEVEPTHVIDLPLDRFVPAPGQGAGAVIVDPDDDEEAVERARARDHPQTARAVLAEHAFRCRLGGAPHAPLAAHAICDESGLRLHGRLFTADGMSMAEAVMVGDDPEQVGEMLARHLGSQLVASQ